MSVSTENKYLGGRRCSMNVFKEKIERRMKALIGLTNAELTPERLKRILTPILVIGKPGIGKTEILLSVANKYTQVAKSMGKDITINVKKIQLGQTLVGEMTGVPVVVDGVIVSKYSDQLPTVERDGEYGILFLDEITSASLDQVQPAMGYADGSRNSQGYTVPEKWLVVGAGNGPDCDNFTGLPAAVLNRFELLEVEYSFRSDFYLWAREHKFNELIMAFLDFKPESILKPRVNVEDEDISMAFPSPRSWTLFNDSLAEYEAVEGHPLPIEYMRDEASAFIGDEVAEEFNAFILYNKNITVNFDKILDGTEEYNDTPDANGRYKYEDFSSEAASIIVERLYNMYEELVKKDGEGICDGDMLNTKHPDVYAKIRNIFNWVAHFQAVENIVRFTAKVLASDDSDIKSILLHMASPVANTEYTKVFNTLDTLAEAVQEYGKQMF